MVKKRVFPDDWSGLTDEQLSENIKYLLEHYKEYKIDKLGNFVYLDNIKIYKFDMNFVYSTIYYVNGKRCTPKNQTWFALRVLLSVCDTEYLVQKEKEQKSDKIKFTCAVAVTVVAFLAGTWFIADQINKEIKFHNKKLKQYEQMKSQIANHGDTLQYTGR